MTCGGCMTVSPYSRTRNKQLIRVLRLLACLESGRWSLAGLSQELRVSTRTIRRDLEAIIAAHIAIRDERTDGCRRWWKVAA